MKRILRILIFGVIFGLAALALQLFFKVDDVTFWRYYIYFAIGVVFLAIVVNSIYFARYTGRLRSLASLLEQGKTRQFVAEIEPMVTTVKNRYLKNLLTVNLSAGYYDLKQYDRAVLLLKDIAGERLPANVKIVYDINMFVNLFFGGKTEEATDYYTAHKATFDRFADGESYGGNIAVIETCMALQNGDKETATDILQGAKRRFNNPRLAKSFAELEQLL